MASSWKGSGFEDSSERRQQTRRGARASAPGVARSKHGDAAAGLRELVGVGAADDAAADHDDGESHHALPRASRKDLIASAGRSAATMAEITATPRGARVEHFAHALAGVTPPTASTGPVHRRHDSAERLEPLRRAVLALRRGVVDGTEDEEVGALRGGFARLGLGMHRGADEETGRADPAQR